MNVATVFPEGYVENERVHQSSSVPKENESFDQERIRRKSTAMSLYFTNPICTSNLHVSQSKVFYHR